MRPLTLAAAASLAACVHNPMQPHQTFGVDTGLTTQAAERILKEVQACDPSAQIISPMGAAAIATPYGTKAIMYGDTNVEPSCMDHAVRQAVQLLGERCVVGDFNNSCGPMARCVDSNQVTVACGTSGWQFRQQ